MKQSIFLSNVTWALTRRKCISCAFAFALFAGVGADPARALDAPPTRRAAEDQGAATLGRPAEVVTKHTIALSGETLAFTARAGAVRLCDAQSGQPGVKFLATPIVVFLQQK